MEWQALADLFDYLRKEGEFMSKNDTVNKADVVQALSDKVNLPKTNCEQVLNGLLETIGEQLAQGKSVTFVGFGTFKTTERAARTGRNPQTGETINIPEATVPSFKAGKALKEKVNK